MFRFSHYPDPPGPCSSRTRVYSVGMTRTVARITRPLVVVALTLTVVVVVDVVPRTEQSSGQPALRSALTFHAAFDGKVDAIHAAGDPSLHWAPSLKERRKASTGLPPSGETQHAVGA